MDLLFIVENHHETKTGVDIIVPLLQIVIIFSIDVINILKKQILIYEK